MRKEILTNNNYYHIYNRGVDKREIFCTKADFSKFIYSMNDFNNRLDKNERDIIKREISPAKIITELSSVMEEKLVDMVCYCLVPNHYHFILKQLTDDGIRIFMHKIGTGFTNYFNLKNNRTGSLFQGPYKSVPVESDEQLLYLSAYVNGNAEIHNVAGAGDWRWGSHNEYLGSQIGKCNKELILKQFKGEDEYREFVNTVIKEATARKAEKKKYLLD